MTNNIFDMNDISDLPDEVIKELNFANVESKQFLELYHLAGGELDLTSLLVGLYRKHRISMPRRHAMSLAYRLKQRGLLEATGRKGVYKITKNGRSVVGMSYIEDDIHFKHE